MPHAALDVDRDARDDDPDDETGHGHDDGLTATAAPRDVAARHAPASDAPASDAPAPNASARDAAGSVGDLFRRFAHAVSNVVGAPATFAVAVLLIIAWAVTGPWMGYSTTWQLIVNTGTTIATFLMVFLVQNTQNRDARAIHLKLDELIRGVKGARNTLIDLENCTEEELAQLEQEYKDLHRRAGEVRTRKARSRTPHRERDPKAPG